MCYPQKRGIFDERIEFFDERQKNGDERSQNIFLTNYDKKIVTFE